MKTYIIASTEYWGNMPDLFLMDENGNYYGVSTVSYAVMDKFPRSVEHWANREGSDAGRRFVIGCEDLDEAVVRKFDELTKEYEDLDRRTPHFEEEYPNLNSGEWKSRKAYRQACDEWMERHDAWVKESNIASFVRRMNDVWQERTELFASLSSAVYEAIKYHDCFRRR